MKTIYAIMVCPEYGQPKLSQVAYQTLEKAQAFIERRADMPERVTPMLYKSRSYEYRIHTLTIDNPSLSSGKWKGGTTL